MSSTSASINSIDLPSSDALFEDVLKQRRSVRGYLEKPVEPAVLQKIFQLAQLAPSNCNVQPWKVYVASGELKDRIKNQLLEAVTNGTKPNPDFSYRHKFEGEYRKRQIDCAVELYNHMGIERGDHEGRGRAAMRNFEFFDAPHAMWLGMDKSFGPSVALDLGMYMQSLMLAMTAYGVSSCAQGALRNYPDSVKQAFNVPDSIGIIVGLSFGYEDESVPANKTRIDRASLAESVEFKE